MLLIDLGVAEEKVPDLLAKPPADADRLAEVGSSEALNGRVYYDKEERASYEPPIDEDLIKVSFLVSELNMDCQVQTQGSDNQRHEDVKQKASDPRCTSGVDSHESVSVEIQCKGNHKLVPHTPCPHLLQPKVPEPADQVPPPARILIIHSPQELIRHPYVHAEEPKHNDPELEPHHPDHPCHHLPSPLQKQIH